RFLRPPMHARGYAMTYFGRTGTGMLAPPSFPSREPSAPRAFDTRLAPDASAGNGNGPPQGAGSGEHPHHARGGGPVSKAGDALLHRQGQLGDAASCLQGVLAREATVRAAARRHDVEVQ